MFVLALKPIVLIKPFSGINFGNLGNCFYQIFFQMKLLLHFFYYLVFLFCFIQVHSQTGFNKNNSGINGADVDGQQFVRINHPGYLADNDTIAVITGNCLQPDIPTRFR